MCISLIDRYGKYLILVWEANKIASHTKIRYFLFISIHIKSVVFHVLGDYGTSSNVEPTSNPIKGAGTTL